MSSSGCSGVDDHGIELVMVWAWIDAMSFQLEPRGYLYLCVVFGEVVVESLKSEDEDQRRVFEIKLSHCLL